MASCEEQVSFVRYGTSAPFEDGRLPVIVSKSVEGLESMNVTGLYDGWDPNQYNRFAAEREQPFWDLRGLLRDVDEPVVVDLGCGDGRLTAPLAVSLGAASTEGLDSSPAMIGVAKERETDRLRFNLADISDWCRPATYDVVFANASMQWVPDHRSVLAKWKASLRERGQICVQVPANADHPSHQLAGSVAREFMDVAPLDPVAQNVLSPEEYSALLHHEGFVEQNVRLQVYSHSLASVGELVEWVKGTTLTRFKEPLGPERWEQFVQRYRERLTHELGDCSPCFYPFKRILMWAQR